MTQAEYHGWIAYYKHYPFDDLHRFHRPAALVGASFSGDIDKKLSWLQPEVFSGNYTDSDLNTMKAFGFKPPKG